MTYFLKKAETPETLEELLGTNDDNTPPIAFHVWNCSSIRSFK